VNKFSVFQKDYDLQEALKREGLTEEDYLEICSRLNRTPNRTELGMFGVMWSEHCCYRNSKPLLQSFPTKGPRILVGPGENAGVVDLGEGERLAFKIESHNHPSAVEPFQGAATGVGGILRDIFTMGARPIALLNALRFGPLEDENNVALMEGVVSGIAHYGNCVGVPTIGGEVVFDKSYSGNPLVNAMALGLMETKDIVCSGASGINNPVLYVGNTTGRDGMGGASFASAELTNSSLDDRPAVQVGDPFLEKGLIEACLQVFNTGDVIAAQDMGAAGLTCSCSEMAAKGNVGIELNLDHVPVREKGMTAYEYLLSESQERMLFVVKPGSEKKLIETFKKWGLYASIVGEVISKNVVRVLHKGEVVAEIPTKALAENTPINTHPLMDKPPEYLLDSWMWDEKKLPQPYEKGIESLSEKFPNELIPWETILLYLLDNPIIASKKWIYSQYDYQVQNNTVIQPGKADAAVIRLRPQNFLNSTSSSFNRGIAAVVDCPNRWVALDPERGTIAAVAEAARNLSCVGAEPLAVTNNLNFSSPEASEGYWQLANACNGLSKACLAFKTPVTGGNVSLYNETRLSDGSINPIQPTPVIGMVGLIEDLNKTCGAGWKKAGDSIWILGSDLSDDESLNTSITLSATTYLECIHGLIEGRPPHLDLDVECSLQKLLRKAIYQNHIKSAHDLSDGGFAVALAECSIFSNLGAEIKIPKSSIRIDKLLFAEGGSRILVSVPFEKNKQWLEFLNNYNQTNKTKIPFYNLGLVNDKNTLLVKQDETILLNLSVSKLTTVFEEAIPSRMRSTKIKR
tara:strand:- start:51 stop:2453 length:2403 start_codon:yes stop_codon:yes gene_type:complete